MLVDKKILIFIVIIVAAITATIYYVFIIKNGSQIISTRLIADISSNKPKKSEKVQLMFVGDLMFDRGIRYFADRNGGNGFVFAEISKVLSENDLVIANLEGPITDEKSISAGSAPGSTNNYFFTFDHSLAKTLFDENIKLVNLGNNHIYNFGVNGLQTTKNYLSGAGVSYFGGENISKTIIKEINGIKIGFISYNEFLTINIQGEINSVLEKITELRKKVDLVVVFSHWGVEYTPTPTESDQNLAHQFIDTGADLIIGSHPHVPQTIEAYNGKKIYYSLGNFIFDQFFDENVRNGLGVVVKIDKTTKQLEFEEIKFYLQGNGQTIIKK